MPSAAVELRHLWGRPGEAPAAAGALFRESERLLRRLVRRWLPPRLRRLLDPADVVQSVWAGLLRGDGGARAFPTRRHLRGYLVRAARHRVVDQVRRQGTAAAREVPVAPGRLVGRVPARDAGPAEEACAAELWDRLVALCPPKNLAVLVLRREGSTLDEVAGGTGLHEGSVRRILRALARRVGAAGGGRGLTADAAPGPSPGARNPTPTAASV